MQYVLRRIQLPNGRINLRETTLEENLPNQMTLRKIQVRKHRIRIPGVLVPNVELLKT